MGNLRVCKLERHDQESKLRRLVGPLGAIVMVPDIQDLEVDLGEISQAMDKARMKSGCNLP